MILSTVAESALKFGLIEPNYTMLMQIGNTIILFLILKKLLFKPVTEFMANREKEITDGIDNAAKLQADAEALMHDYKSKIKNVEEEGRQIIRTATQRAETKADELIKHTHAEIEELKKKAEKEIERERSKAVNSLKDEISSIAILAASKILEKDIDEATHKELINQFINEVGDTRWQN